VMFASCERRALRRGTGLEAITIESAMKNRISNRKIFRFAHPLRQDRVMAPYLESIT
jgi:hypothetical protein